MGPGEGQTQHLEMCPPVQRSDSGNFSEQSTAFLCSKLVARSCSDSGVISNQGVGIHLEGRKGHGFSCARMTMSKKNTCNSCKGSPGSGDSQ